MTTEIPNTAPDVAQDDPYSASRAMEERLRSTTDVTVWAAEFCNTFDGWDVIRHGDDRVEVINEGTMIAWFANYAQTVNDQLHQQRIKNGVNIGTWQAFLHFYYADCANAAFHTAEPRFSPITFRLAEFIISEHGVQFAIDPDARLSQVLAHVGEYEEDPGR